MPLTRSIAARTTLVYVHMIDSYVYIICRVFCSIFFYVGMYPFRCPVSTSATQLQTESYVKRNKKMGRPLSPSLAILAKK